MRTPRRRIWLVGLLGFVGCGGDDPLTGLEGLYTISAWTENPQACDAEGASIAAGRDPMLYVEADAFFGTDLVNVVACPDQAACTTQARDSELMFGEFFFDTGSDADGWTSHVVGVGGDGSGNCTGAVADTTLTAVDHTITIQRRTIVSAPFTGQCSTDDADAAAVGQPCASLEVLRATFTAKF